MRIHTWARRRNSNELSHHTVGTSGRSLTLLVRRTPAAGSADISFRRADTNNFFGPSSLACSGPLIALTQEPEQVDPAPETPPKLLSDRARGDLITENDYPIPAVSKGQEGITTMRLQIGSHGRVDRCRVTLSSGSDALDEKACMLLRSRAHFEAARNAKGQKVAAEFSYSHEWRSPQ